MKATRAIATSLIAVTLGLLEVASPAEAALVSFEFAGEVLTNKDNVFGITDAVGDRYTGRLTYDSGVADSASGLNLGQYWQTSPAAGMSVTFQSGATVTNLGQFVVEVANANGPFEADFFGASSQGARVNGVPIANGFFVFPRFFDFRQSAFASDALPTTLDPASFELTNSYPSWVCDTNPCTQRGAYLQFDIDTLSISSVGQNVPEPATPLLLAFASLPWAVKRLTQGRERKAST
jgi:hypothetical protein